MWNLCSCSDWERRAESSANLAQDTFNSKNVVRKLSNNMTHKYEKTNSACLCSLLSCWSKKVLIHFGRNESIRKSQVYLTFGLEHWKSKPRTSEARKGILIVDATNNSQFISVIHTRFSFTTTCNGHRNRSPSYLYMLQCSLEDHSILLKVHQT